MFGAVRIAYSLCLAGSSGLMARFGADGTADATRTPCRAASGRRTASLGADGTVKTTPLIVLYGFDQTNGPVRPSRPCYLPLTKPSVMVWSRSSPDISEKDCLSGVPSGFKHTDGSIRGGWHCQRTMMCCFRQMDGPVQSGWNYLCTVPCEIRLGGWSGSIRCSIWHDG